MRSTLFVGAVLLAAVRKVSSEKENMSRIRSLFLPVSYRHEA
jgi:hypothetical protein